MSKKTDKKLKKLKKLERRLRAAATGAGQGNSTRTSNGNGNGQGRGLFGGLGRLLPRAGGDQFLVGMALGAAAAYVLSDEAMRGKILRSGVSLYTSLAGGLEEMKEQMADIQAEMAAERNGVL